MNLTDHIQLACLPQDPRDDLIEETAAYAVGWGVSSWVNEILPNDLKNVKIRILNSTLCKIKGEMDTFDDDSQICAGKLSVIFCFILIYNKY